MQYSTVQYNIIQYILCACRHRCVSTEIPGTGGSSIDPGRKTMKLGQFEEEKEIRTV